MGGRIAAGQLRVPITISEDVYRAVQAHLEGHPSRAFSRVVEGALLVLLGASAVGPEVPSALFAALYRGVEKKALDVL